MRNQRDIDREGLITLENLTPGGSEFHNDPARCREWIQRIKTECHEVVIKLRREKEELLKQLDAITDVVSMTLWEINDQNTGYYYQLKAEMQKAQILSRKAKGELK